MHANNDSKFFTTRVKGMKKSLKGTTMKTMMNYNVVSLQPKTLDTSVKHLKLGGEEEEKNVVVGLRWEHQGKI